GSFGTDVQVYDDGVVVGGATGAANGPAGTISAWPRGVVIEVDGADFLIWCELEPDSSVDLGGAKAPINGDLLQLRVANPPMLPDPADGMHLVTAGTGRMLITTSAPSAPTAAPPSARFATTLLPPQPNPFNPRTQLSFELGAAGRVRLAIYDAAGRRVRLLVDELLPAGRHERIWQGVDDRGTQVASGVYFVRMAAPGKSAAQKVVLVK
ncbi:MAG TPA: FlgD immunoglobulin-like domain containing protein, partial [Pseudomonadales bacterium]|nr:FlgD immunoglobulin-like domain containing protein [Pseudomonadales bacterium]